MTGVELLPGGEAAGAHEVVVAERLTHPEVAQHDGRDAAVQGLQRGRGADRDQQVRTVQDLAHVPVDELEVGRKVGALGQLLVRQFLDVRGVLAGLGAQLEQHLALGVQLGVLHEAVQQIRTVLAALRDGGLGGEHHGVGVTMVTCVRSATQEGECDFGHRGGVGADTVVYGLEPVGVLTGVGEDQVGAVAQQEAVGQLLVDDADIAGDDDRAQGLVLPHVRQAVQHRLDAAPDEGEDKDVVRLLLVHGPQELQGGHLAQRVGRDADLLELAGRGRGSASQEVAVEVNV